MEKKLFGNFHCSGADLVKKERKNTGKIILNLKGGTVGMALNMLTLTNKFFLLLSVASVSNSREFNTKPKQ
jgi:hypothetical protein